MNVLFIVLSIITAILYLYFAYKTKMFVKSILLSAFIGLFLLIMLNIFGSKISCFLPINIYTIITSGILGLPGIILLLFLNIIFV